MKRKAFPVILLFVLAFLPFLPTLGAGFLNWDDDFYLTENPDIVSPQGWRNTLSRFATDANVYPVVFASFRLEHRLWGFNPRGYHTANVILHGLVAVSAFLFLLQLGADKWVAWWVCVLFAVHPMQTATVAWVSEIKSLLGTFFLLWAWIGFVRSAGTEKHPLGHAKQKFLFGGLSLLSALLAYLSKSSLVIFPVLLFMAEKVRGNRFGSWGWGHLVLASIVGWVYAGRETGPAIPLIERVFLVPRSLWFYVERWVFPAQVGGVHPKWETSAFSVANMVAVVGFGLTAALLYRFRQKVKRLQWLGLFLFLIALAPCLGLLAFGYQQHAYVSDHFAYLALLGISLFSVSFLDRLEKLKRTGIVCAIALLWGCLSWSQCEVWKSSENFWKATLIGNPANWAAHQNLATELDRQGRIEEALGHYEDAVRIEPENPVGWINLGRSRIRSGSGQAAVESLNRAIELNPHYEEAYGFLVEALSQLGRYDEAFEVRRKAPPGE